MYMCVCKCMNVYVCTCMCVYMYVYVNVQEDMFGSVCNVMYVYPVRRGGGLVVALFVYISDISSNMLYTYT